MEGGMDKCIETFKEKKNTFLNEFNLKLERMMKEELFSLNIFIVYL